MCKSIPIYIYIFKKVNDNDITACLEKSLNSGCIEAISSPDVYSAGSTDLWHIRLLWMSFADFAIFLD
jgi:hypothetical protein